MCLRKPDGKITFDFSGESDTPVKMQFYISADEMIRKKRLIFETQDLTRWDATITTPVMETKLKGEER